MRLFFSFFVETNNIMRFRIIILLQFLTLATHSQKKNPVAQNARPGQPANAHLALFNQAVAANDLVTATIALNYYVSGSGSDNQYTDTLAMLYLQQGMYAQCQYWTDLRLGKTPENRTLLEMKAVCLEKTGRTKEAIALYEQLFASGGNPYHAYQLMELQYGIKRLVECIETGRAAEKLGFKPEYRMTYTLGKQTGSTFLEAGIYNIHALALYDLGNKVEARKYLEKALSLDSSFALARQNLNALSSLEPALPGKGIPATDTKQKNNNPAQLKEQN